MGYKYSNDVEKTKEYNLMSLPEIKPHLNVDEDFFDDDILILRQMNQAISLCEDYTNIDIADTSCTKEYYGFVGNSIQINERPFQTVTSIVATDDEDVESELTGGTDFYVIKKKTQFFIKFNESIDYKKIVVKFKTGYTRTTLPPAIQAAIGIKTNDLYDMERTSFTIGVNYKENKAFERCLNKYVTGEW